MTTLEFSVGTAVTCFEGERGTITKMVKRDKAMVELESGETLLCYLNQLSLPGQQQVETPVDDIAAQIAPPAAPAGVRTMLEKNAALLGVTVEELGVKPVAVKPVTVKAAQKAKPVVAMSSIQLGDRFVSRRPISNYGWPLNDWLKINEPVEVAETREVEGAPVYRIQAVDEPSRGPADGGGWWVPELDLVTASKKVTT